MNLTLLVEEVIKIVEKAGEAVVGIYKNNDLEISLKTDQSPVTRADMESNKIICDALFKLNSNIPIISEESRAAPYPDRRKYEYLWLVDPLDGTKEFIKKNGEFTINIALIHLQKVIMGVVYVPAIKEIYWAIQGRGAFIKRNGERQKIGCASFKPSQNGLRALISRSHLNEATKTALNIFNDPVLISMGSAVKFMTIAKGEADVYCRLGVTMEWDTAAPQIILEEAGGNMFRYDEDQKKSVASMFETHLPMIYNKEDLRNPNFVAFGRLIQ